MKRRLVYILSLIVAGVLGITLFAWFDGEKTINTFLNDSLLSGKAQLAVSLEKGQANVIMGEKALGSTPVDLNELTPQKTTLTLTRNPNPNGFYHNLEVPVELTARSQTVVVGEIGPTFNSSWYVTSWIAGLSTEDQVIVQSLPEAVEVFIDGEYLGKTPLRLRELSREEHQVRLVKKGYLELETEVTPIKNKTIIVTGKLYKLPVELPHDN